MILHLLRDATRREHEQLEARIDLLGRGWSLSFYRLLLQKFYGFYSVVEPPLFGRPEWQQLGFDIEPRRKTELLRRDLGHLGLEAGQIEALPRPENAPPLSSFPSLLGCAYVLEGATLGGQVITRHLRREIGIEPEQGGAFFASYGALVGPMWREFVALLDTFPVSVDEQSALVESARATFAALDDWLGDIL